MSLTLHNEVTDPVKNMYAYENTVCTVGDGAATRWAWYIPCGKT
jgi:hypothetical protein